MAEFSVNLAASAFSGRQPRRMRRVARYLSVCLLVTGMFAGLLLSASPAGAVAGFGDVDDDEYFTKPVQWMVDNNIATDTTGPCFAPHTPATRGQTALYMWRMQGQPEAPPHPFDDVTDDGQHPAVSWMYDTEITTGTTPTTFGPDQQLTRAQVAALLHRLAGEPAASVHPFVDVVAGWQQQPVAWMVADEITTGTSPTTFAPNEPVTRGQLATFLYRYSDSPNVTVNPHSERCNAFTTVSARGQHTCGLRTNQTITCWGHNEHQQATAPEGAFIAVSAGWQHSCAIRTNKTITCWGHDNVGQAKAPGGTFVAVTAGYNHSCAIRTDKTITCWGHNDHGQTESPDTQFTAVSAGNLHTCGLTSPNNTIACWGSNFYRQTEAPRGQFTAISTRHDRSCATRSDNTITCWGRERPIRTEPPSGQLFAVSVGHSHACGLRSDNTIACWSWGIASVGQTEVPDGRFTSITSAKYHSCGIRTNATVTCWGLQFTDPTDVSYGSFSAISAGGTHSCGIHSDDTITCWGSISYGRAVAPSGLFTAVSAGAAHSCAIRTNATVACWGRNNVGQTDAPDGRFIAVSTGTLHSCGVRADNSIICWGAERLSQSGTVGESFSDVAATNGHWCGLRTDGTITCWGTLLAPPEGTFSSIDAGTNHWCGLRTDNTVACWGSNNFGADEPPNGTFLAVSTSNNRSCALRPDNTVTCWGQPTRVPNGTFTAVSAGGDHTCGLRTDNTVTCWTERTRPIPPGVQYVPQPGQADPAMCRPFGISGIGTAGFPLSAGRVRSTGTARVAVLFVDFPDAAASYSTQIEAEMGLPYAEAYLEASSYQKLDVEFVPLHGWLRADESYEHYQDADWGHNGVGPPIDTDAVRLADPDFDFTNIDALMVVLPSSHFGGGTASAAVRTNEGDVFRKTLINVFPLAGARDPSRWGQVAAHELIHNLGLLDLYASEGVADHAADAPADKTWVTSRFGLMGLGADFPANPQDPRLLQIRLYPDGAQSTGYETRLEAEEMLAWSRWQLGWIDSTQTACVTENEATVTLGPIADPGDSIAMAAIPLSGTDVIVVESRRKIGFDNPRVEHYSDGVIGTFPTLLADGVLIYTVDASLHGGRLPVVIAGDTGNLQVDHYPILTDGESVTIRGYTITVQSSTDTTHTVSITKTTSG